MPVINEARVYRVRLAGRVGVVPFGVFLISVAVALGLTTPSVGLVLVPLAIIATLWLALSAFVPYIRLGPNEVVVRNLFTRVSLRYEDIAMASPGYYGITIRAKSGKVVLARAVQKANASSWTKKHVRADEVVEELLNRAGASGDSSGSVQ